MNIFITGANSGFGREMTIALANAGHRVFAGIRALEGRNASAASELIQTNTSTSGAIEPVEIDVASDMSVDTAISEVLARTDGALDLVINNAGQYLGGLNETLSVAQVENMTNVNFLGPLPILRAVLPHLRARGRGTVITVTSDVSRLVLPGSGLYAATKSALGTAAESYAMELAPLGIESLIVQPGAFDTGIMQKAPASNGAARMTGYGPTLGHLQKMGEASWPKPERTSPKDPRFRLPMRMWRC